MQLTVSSSLPVAEGATRKIVRIMKLTAAFILICALHVSAKSVGQPVTLNVKDVTLKEVFRQIQRQTGLNILVDQTLLNNSQKKSIRVENADLNDVLQQLLQNEPLSFSIVDGRLVIKSAPELKRNPTRHVSAAIDITGKVTGENGEPLEGVSVNVKGTTLGTSTNVNGIFFLSNVDPDATLVFTGVNIERYEAKVEGRKTIDVRVKSNILEGQSVVVSTGYQRLPKERITGSFSTVGAQQLQRTISYNITDKLEGALSGLLYDPLGVTIRGVSTLNASRLPLVILDGFPITIDKDNNDYADANEFAAFQRALESINPNDVENITVLKDAAAASIWGARAANGVIVITTKHTKSRDPEINFSSNFSFIPKPDLNLLPYANPETQLMLEKGRFDAGWFDAFLLNMDLYYYNLSDYAYVARRVQQNQLPASALETLTQQMRTYDNRQDYSKYFMQNARHQQYNLSVSQNTGFNNYRFSASFDNDLALLQRNDENRVVLNFTNQFRPSDWLSFSVGSNISLRREKQNGMGIDELYNILPHQPFLDADGKYTSQTTFRTSLNFGRPFRESFYAANPWLPYDWNYNLKRELDNNDHTVSTSDARFQGGITIRPFKDVLTLDIKYQHERGTIRSDDLYNEETWETRFKVNQFASPTGTHPVPKGSFFDQAYNTSYSHDFLTTASFVKAFASDHQVAVLAGAEFRDEFRDKSNSRRYAYNPQTLTWATQMDYKTSYPRNMYPSNPYFIESSFSTIYNYWLKQDRYISTFGNFSYNFKSTYDITASWRLDRSNMFGKSPKYRQVPLWSVGGAWSIHKESFFNIPAVDRLRIRGTYGTSGNVDKTTSPFSIATVGGSQVNSTLQLQGAQYINPANSELRWETTEQVNVGLEFSILKNRIYGEVEYYNKQGRDLLATKALNSTYGFTNALINFGGIKNTGVDVTVSAMVVNKPVTWRTQIMQSFNRNIVTKTDLKDITQVALSYLLSPNSSNRIQTGKPRYYILSIPWAGLSADGLPQFYHDKTIQNAITTTLPANTTSYGFSNLIYEGATQAPYYGSWNNVIGFKQFELSFMAVYKFGHVYLHTSPFRVTNNDLYGFAQGNLVPHYAKEFENMWKKPGDEAHTNIPRLPLEYTGTTARSKTAWYNYSVNFGDHQVMNAATIRLQRVTLSYALNKSWLPRKVKDVRFMIQGRNLHTFTFNPYKEDPERLPDMMGNFLLNTRPEYTFSLQAAF